jgi:predicted permease
VKPASALKGGEVHARPRLMNALVAAQVAFCILVQLIAGLFISTFDRLVNRPLGFSPANVAALDVVAPGSQSPDLWYQVADHLRSLPQVENASVSNFALMSGGSWTMSLWANGRTPESDTPAYFLSVSPSWLDTLKVPLLEGRGLRADDAFPPVAIVNQTFARHYFPGQSAVGRTFETMQSGKRVATLIVGVAADARYTGMRRPVPVTVYVPFRNLTQAGTSADTHAVLSVRTKDVSPLALATLLRQGVRQAHPAFRVANIRTQDELIRSQTIRERLLATLSLFFGVAALVLASVGLYGVLHYAVTQRRRELGIRIALGAGVKEIANRVTASVLAMVGVGAVVGLAAGIFSERFIKSLLFGVKATDPAMLAWAMFAVSMAVVLAALPAVIRAVRIDPAGLLRSE